jgi:hypothetical protein
LQYGNARGKTGVRLVESGKHSLIGRRRLVVEWRDFVRNWTGLLQVECQDLVFWAEGVVFVLLSDDRERLFGYD